MQAGADSGEAWLHVAETVVPGDLATVHTHTGTPALRRRPRTGYTTNLPLADLTGGKAWVVWSVDGEPLPAEHGGPARLLVPHLSFWKSAKWVSGLQFMGHDEPGFWERNGYHDRGDPRLEQRYQAD